MKKLIVVVCLFALLLSSLTSCGLLIIVNWTPDRQPMSKWVADGIELYVLEDNADSFMIVNYGDTQMFYRFRFSYRAGPPFSIDDIRKYSYHEIASGDFLLISDAKFKVTMYDSTVFGGGHNLPELMFPKEIIFTRVATDLTEEDIPQIAIDPQYSFCPIFSETSKWVSDDLQMTLINNEPLLGQQKCQLASDPNTQFHVNFFESNSSAYLTKITEENKSSSETSLIVSQSTEEWACEYFEDHFLATVIRSEYYEPGHVLTFTPVSPDTTSATESTTGETK